MKHKIKVTVIDKKLYPELRQQYCADPNTGVCSCYLEIGFYGQRHLYFLQHYHRVTYINLLTSGNLNEYFVEIDKQAQKRFFRIVEQMKQKQEMTEQLKAINPIKWTQLMNCIRQQANEIIFEELIFN